MRIQPLIALAAVVSMTSALADTVFLTNGGVLEGRVSDEDGRIVVEQATGKVYLDRAKVDHIERSESALDEYDAKFAAVKAKGADAMAGDWAQVGRFAADHSMRDRAERCYFKALALDPDNATARLALGFEKFQDKWMTSDEANLARGMVKYNGSWVTPEAKAELLKLDAIAQVERARAAAEGAKAAQEEAKLERADKELQLIEAQREALPVVNGGTVYVSPPRHAELPSGAGTSGVPSAGAAPAAPAAPSHPVTASAPSHSPPTTSFSPVQVDTPDGGSVRQGPGGSLITTPPRR